MRFGIDKEVRKMFELIAKEPVSQRMAWDVVAAIPMTALAALIDSVRGW